MPYESQAQAAFMHIHHPEIAKRWDKEYHEGKFKHKKLPKHKKEASIDQQLLLNLVTKRAKHDMPHFTDQDRSEKSKNIYKALKRDHPEMPAEEKARIAGRQGKPGHHHQGPPYSGPLTKKSGVMDMVTRLGAKVGPIADTHLLSPVAKAVENVAGGSLGQTGASIANKVKPYMQNAGSYLRDAGNKVDMSYMSHMGPATIPSYHPNAARNIGLATLGIPAAAAGVGMMRNKEAAVPYGLLGALGGAGIGAATANEGDRLGGALKGGLIGGGVGMAAPHLAAGFRKGFGVPNTASATTAKAAPAAVAAEGTVANKTLAATSAGAPAAAAAGEPIVRSGDIAKDMAAKYSKGSMPGSPGMSHSPEAMRQIQSLNHANRANMGQPHNPGAPSLPGASAKPPISTPEKLSAKPPMKKAGEAIGTPYTDGILSWCLKNNLNGDQVLDMFEKGAAQEGKAGQECKAFLDRLLAE